MGQHFASYALIGLISHSFTDDDSFSYGEKFTSNDRLELFDREAAIL